MSILISAATFFEQLIQTAIEKLLPLILKIVPLEKIVSKALSSPETVSKIADTVVSSDLLTPEMISGAVESGVVSPEVISDAINAGTIPATVLSEGAVAGEITAGVVSDAIASGQFAPEVISQAIQSGDVSSEMVSGVVTEALESGAVSPEVVSEMLSDVISPEMLPTEEIAQTVVSIMPDWLSTAVFIGGIAFLVLWLLAVIFLLIALWRIYSKAGQPGWAVLIPFFDNFIYYRITWGSGAFWLLSLIPFAGPIIKLITSHKLARSFGHRFGFTLGLWFFPWIFHLILGFGKSKYKGPTWRRLLMPV